MEHTFGRRCHLASIDIKDAYLHVPIFGPYQRFLRFAVEGSHFQFVALPFGLATAPKVFTKVLAPVLASLRSQGVSKIGYMDDLLLRECSRPTLVLNVSSTVRVLQRLGWVLNLDKSALCPTQALVYLGLILDTAQERVFLPPFKFASIVELVQKVKKEPTPSVRLCIRLLGKMVSSFSAVPYAQFHSRVFQNNILKAWDKSARTLDQPMVLSPRVLWNLSWWLRTSNLKRGKSFPPVAWRVVTTDASLLGWGAVLEEASVQGVWSQTEKTLPINLLEIRAARLALRFWTSRLQGLPVRVPVRQLHSSGIYQPRGR
ncbi:uncharacterized protein [Aquarana catesbeiana]|uniref:uncharacterized protein isoform X1 n=1 Tax=Aquarana catesbeiana TaxID=8400 RepID=UPI003CC964A5